MSVSQRFLAAATFTAVASLSFYLAQGQAQEPGVPGFQPQPQINQGASPSAPGEIPLPPPPPIGEIPGGSDPGVSLTQPALAPAPAPGPGGAAPTPTEGGPATSSAQPGQPAKPLEPAEPQELHALIKTRFGDIEIKLFDRLAPNNVKNFIALTKGDREFVDIKTGRKISKPYYDGLTFHRVVKGFVVQGGCPFGNGRGGPGYTIPDEINSNLHHDKPGIVSMAPARKEGALQKDTNGSQFFITLVPMPELDGKATIIGEVIKGMSVVQKISRVPVGPTDRPIKKVIMNSVNIISVTRGSSKKPATPTSAEPLDLSTKH